MEAGADILQVFEAMGGFISEDHFYERAMPYLARCEYSDRFYGKEYSFGPLRIMKVGE